MNLFELLIFLGICVGLGFLGHLFSHHYGWIVGVLAAPVLIFFMIRGFAKKPR
jgi:hypothetical protein